jgi:AraC-like DNA-binding protein
MRFARIDPQQNTRRVVECYWIVEDDNSTPVRQKIIPDGFAEIIFHFGDLYRINLKSKWTTQARSLVAGQIRKHFFLENSGVSSIIGVKLQPQALTMLFELEMHTFTDMVLDLRKALRSKMNRVEDDLRAADTEAGKIAVLDEYFCARLRVMNPDRIPIERAIALIFDRKGMITVGELAAEMELGERALEKIFKHYIGLSPKFYTRIVRFNHIFQLIKDKGPDWADIVFKAGYYDQSHFIRNFKAFTGEDPTSYMFEEKSLANFFLKKE